MKRPLKGPLSRWWLAAYVASVPVMLNNPAAPFIHLPLLSRLQISEFIFVGLLLTAWWESRLTWRRVVGTPLVLPLALYVAAAALSLLGSARVITGLGELVVVAYLVAIYIVAFQLLDSEGALRTAVRAFAAGVALTVVAGVVGVLLLAAGVETPLAEKGYIITASLSIQDYIPWVPRVPSTLKPVANMTAAFWAVAVGLLVPWAVYEPGLRQKALVRWTWIGALLLSPLTFSRAIIGLFVAWAIVLRSGGLGSRALRTGAWVAALVLLLLTPLLSVWYIRDVRVAPETDPSAQKESVELREGSVRQNPVYFFREGAGAEKLTLQVDYAYNHYYWLKRGAWAMFWSSPAVGVGAGNFLGELNDLSGKTAEVPAGLKNYESAQSQVFTTLAEQGLLGAAALVLLWAAVLRLLWGGARRGEGPGQAIALGALAAVAGVLLSSIDMDVMNFRFVWVALALGVAATRLGLKARESAG